MDPAVKRKASTIAIILLLAVGGYLGWRLSRPSGPGDAFASGNGRIEATEVDLAAKLGGRIDDIWDDEGDFDPGYTDSMRVANVFEFTDGLVMTRGKHTIKVLGAMCSAFNPP